MTEYVEWQEPFGQGKYGYICRAKKEEVIRYMRDEYQYQFTNHPNYPYKSDEEALADFLIIHWAKLVVDK